LTVYGFGERKTPEAFRNACHKFVFTEVLKPIPAQAVAEVITPSKQVTGKKQITTRQETAVRASEATKDVPGEFFVQALEQASDDRGWAHLGKFGSYLTKLRPDFDARNFGYKKLSDLVKARNDLFEIEERKLASSGKKDFYIRIRAK
jgi:OST-HTH/LOTUS domain